ncbi:MAG: NUDIX hydrolase [Algoriphagus sp.]|uniref:NUDIX domain-containing protein n=1 Tax=Algoriphagus sp. TaxID=1872435 RepID=UPI00272FD6C1|nr:NUDIX hydrolase [Algoriphagus sp.]MDP2039976.1 NUDIX hydrolase [Algoriphagus sp.]MDP3470750.1 NUDIX hydrolase [Algoriphagus sp.]
MTENPWQTLKVSTVYENPWIRMEHHDIVNPTGKAGIYGVVHFKNRAIGVIPIDKEGNTWLIGQYRYALKEYSWEIPMGGGPNELDLLESAKRELKEETGLTAEKWTQIMKIHTSNSVTDELGYVYLAKDLTQGETEFEETEVLQVRKLPFQEALDMVMSGEITDSLSIAGILKAARILGF